MSKYVAMTRVYLVVLTVFVALRFALEVAGANQTATAEISVTRLYFMLPVFLGLRFATENLGGFVDMLLANFTYFLWGNVMVNLAVALEVTLDLGTHYFFPGWLALPIVIVVGTVITTIICWVTCLINRKFLPQTSAYS